MQIGDDRIGQRLWEERDAQTSVNFIGDIFLLLEINCATGMFQRICLAPLQHCSGFGE